MPRRLVRILRAFAHMRRCHFCGGAMSSRTPGARGARCPKCSLHGHVVCWAHALLPQPPPPLQSALSSVQSSGAVGQTSAAAAAAAGAAASQSGVVLLPQGGPCPRGSCGAMVRWPALVASVPSLPKNARIVDIASGGGKRVAKAAGAPAAKRKRPASQVRTLKNWVAAVKLAVLHAVCQSDI